MALARGLVVVAMPSWGVLVVNAVPATDLLISNGQATLAACLAVAGTMAAINLRIQRPAEDVWEAGRAHGRREAMHQVTVPRVVAHLAGARRRDSRDGGVA